MYRNIEKTVYKVTDFLSWQRNDSLVLSPSFQRRPVWPPEAKSLLLDTVVRGLPIPIIFLRERTDLSKLEPKREIVDGQQRLRTLIAFIEPNLLKDYDPQIDAFVVKKHHNAEIAGKTFRQLDASIQKRILNYSFSVHILSSDTDDREVLMIFSRMNATGVKLNAQELRNAAYIGSFKNTAYNLAHGQLTRWRSWKVFSESEIARMIEVEETSDLIIIMLEGMHGRSQTTIEKYYKKYEPDFPFENEVDRRFNAVMDKIEETLGNNLRSMAFSRKGLFNTLFTFYYDLMFSLNSAMDKKQPNSMPPEVSTAVKNASDEITHGRERLDETLLKVLRGATANYGSRKMRLEFLQKIYRRAKS